MSTIIDEEVAAENNVENSKIIRNLHEVLCKPFPSKDVQWRLSTKSKDGKKGMVLAYIDARAIMERLDEAFDIWTVEYRPIDMGEMDVEVRGSEITKSLKGFICKITGIKNGLVVTREDGCNCTDFEPVKGGISGAFKRAGASLGIGRYLYNLTDTWVNLKDYGKFDTPQLPDWALPEEERGKTTKVSTVTQTQTAAPIDMSKHICEKCGAKVTEKVAQWSKNKFDKVLCYGCQQKERN